MEITITNASKCIGKNTILTDVNMKLSSGNIYGFQGPNGSGKTMLMRLIVGLIRPSSGTICVDGKILGRDMDFPPSVGMLLENPAFLLEYTGFANLKLFADINKRVTTEQIRQVMTDIGLDPSDKRKVRKYSLGMKQRLGIAAAIMGGPDLIVLDEPTNALDDAGVQQVCTLIRNQADQGALILLSCHNKALLESLADQIYCINGGKVGKRNEGRQN